MPPGWSIGHSTPVRCGRSRCCGDAFAGVTWLATTLIASGGVDLGVMVTHRYKPDQIEEAYELIGHRSDGVLKLAIAP